MWNGTSVSTFDPDPVTNKYESSTENEPSEISENAENHNSFDLTSTLDVISRSVACSQPIRAEQRTFPGNCLQKVTIYGIW